MPLYREYDDYYAENQRGQALALHDPTESIQSKLPVEDGEVVLTQTRLYLATGIGGPQAPNIRLERSEPRAILEEEWLEIAPRMGARLAPGQNPTQFLQTVAQFRRLALDRHDAARRAGAAGLERRYAALLARAMAAGQAGRPRAMKDILRSLHAAVPGRQEAALWLGELYLGERNPRAAVRWLSAARAFDARFDQALAGVERPRLPSRELPPPEWWLERNLAPLLDLPDGSGPDAAQRERIRRARQRITAFRAARGRATPAAWLAFGVTIVLWLFIVSIFPWTTLVVTTATAILLGMLAAWRARGRRAPKR
jgi:hypothetical protein